MKTKELIKDTARGLFNEKGVRNTTLRVVAETLGKSYGNITYHYANKEVVIDELFNDMNQELSDLQSLLPSYDNILSYILALPEFNFDILRKYIFFTLDYVELKRNYPDFFLKVTELNTERGAKWLQILKMLCEENFLVNTLTTEDLSYIMELSVGIRMFYFQNTSIEKLNKNEFTFRVNQLLQPYLTSDGLRTYQSSQHT
jgi:AcrR family transcriptional regulator